MSIPRRSLVIALTAPALTRTLMTAPGVAPLAGPVPRAEPTTGQRVVRPAPRGVNLSGAEFTPDARHLPGVADTDYRYPTQADLRYVASRGHRMVRLPIRWERIQPDLLGPLDRAELRRLTTVLEHAERVGLRVLVDLHNYARYIRPSSRGGATLLLGDGHLTNAHLVDVWARLSAALRGNPGILGYGLMNEPHHLPGGRAATATTTVASFDDSVGPWAGEADASTARSTAADTTHGGGGSLRISRPLSAGASQVIRANDGAKSALDPAAGGTLTCWVLVPRGTSGTSWRAQLELQDSSYRWRAGPSTNLTPGRWTSISVTPDQATWAQHRGVAVQFSSDQTRAGTASVYVDDLRQQGVRSSSTSEAAQWQRASQECVDAIRSTRDTTAIYVPGVAFSGAQHWPEHHPRPWIDDPADATVYEAHYYFDRDNSGTYPHQFSAENADAVRRGYASLADRATTELGRFLDWCRAFDVTGFVGEIGWDNRRDVEAWNAVGEALYSALDEARVGAAYWAAGQWYGTSYNLSVYTGTPLSQRSAPATVVEAHPSLDV